jgi:hypothetical protein
MTPARVFPEAIAPYAKGWTALLGFLFVTGAELWDAAPNWVAILGSLLSAAAVWAVPNRPAAPADDIDEHSDEHLLPPDEWDQVVADAESSE